MIEYRIEEYSTAQTLQESVKRLLKEGWEPQGSVSVAYKRTVGFNTPVMAYCQALVRRSNNGMNGTAGNERR
jgi:hypothetical protein